MMTIINRVFITIFLLSVAGTVVASTFLAIQRFLYRHTSAGFMVKLNKVVIFSLVVPFFYVLGMLDRTNHYLSQYDVVVLVEQGTVKGMAYSLRELIGFADMISMLWLAGLALYLLVYAITYAVFVYRVKKGSWMIRSGSWRAVFDTLCWSNGLSEKQARLIASPWMKQVCTIGIWVKTIVVPVYLLEKLDESETSIILRHEMTHIRKNDVALHAGMFVLCSLNWFNPLVYYLNENLGEWIELSCDEEMLALADSSYRHAYINALLKIMEEQRAQAELKGHQSVSYFHNGKSIDKIKRRMNGIMKKREVKKAAQVFGLASICCAMACGTALARDLEYPVNAIFSDHVDVVDEEEYFESEVVEYRGGFGYGFIDFESIVMKVPLSLEMGAEYEIVYQDGTREIITNGVGTERAHTHTYKEINVNKHQKKSNGSCTVTTYAAEKCTTCGYVVRGDKISTQIFEKCPH